MENLLSKKLMDTVVKTSGNEFKKKLAITNKLLPKLYPKKIGMLCNPLVWGTRGREFESHHSDKQILTIRVLDGWGLVFLDLGTNMRILFPKKYPGVWITHCRASNQLVPTLLTRNIVYTSRQ